MRFNVMSHNIPLMVHDDHKSCHEISMEIFCLWCFGIIYFNLSSLNVKLQNMTALY